MILKRRGYLCCVSKQRYPQRLLKFIFYKIDLKRVLGIKHDEPRFEGKHRKFHENEYGINFIFVPAKKVLNVKIDKSNEK